jgi:hypothetical protein
MTRMFMRHPRGGARLRRIVAAPSTFATARASADRQGGEGDHGTSCDGLSEVASG